MYNELEIYEKLYKTVLNSVLLICETGARFDVLVSGGAGPFVATSSVC